MPNTKSNCKELLQSRFLNSEFLSFVGKLKKMLDIKYILASMVWPSIIHR